jgi:hypothetical protein
MSETAEMLDPLMSFTGGKTNGYQRIMVMKAGSGNVRKVFAVMEF